MLDLSLLRTFLAVYETGSVTGAATRMSVTQPSVSYALGRLRKQLDDPLFIRTRAAMVATERAQELYQVFRRSVADIDAVSSDQAFDPGTSELQFRLCLSDLGEFSFLPAILARLRHEAPKVALDVVPTDIAKVQGWLRQGQVDAAIASIPIPGLRRRTIISRDRYVCVLPADRASAGSPGTSGGEGARRATMSVEEFESLRHVVIDESAGHQQVDATLEEAGLRRRTVVRLRHFSVLPNLMNDSDVAAVMPLVAAEHFERQWPVVIRELPIPGPAFDVNLYWNEATSGSAAVQWFLRLLTEALVLNRGE
ncbi:LysR family transcriptional regulator [Sinomonas flava]|uniref:LysR family transcriptional regulator n=1 Tax=Sinomonas flava TaxID=496857 RepID=UPI0039A633B6